MFSTRTTSITIAKYLPPGVVTWVKRGELTIKLADSEVRLSHPGEEWRTVVPEKCLAKYGLDKNKEIIEVSTGKLPIYVEGDLYPNIDYANDPDAAIKFIHNVVAMRGRLGSCALFSSAPSGSARVDSSASPSANTSTTTSGTVRTVQIPNRNEMLQQQLYKFVKPYDLQGMTNLTQRFLDPKPDAVYAYVPAPSAG